MSKHAAVLNNALTRKLLLIASPRQGSISSAPELMPWLEKGWHVIEACPRITEEGARLLVLLGRDEGHSFAYPA